MEGDLGNDPTLRQGLNLFLAQGMAQEQDDAPGPFTSRPEGSIKLPSEGLQHHLTHPEPACSKVLPWPSAGWSQSQPLPKADEPHPVNHPHRWIHAEMEKIGHPH